MKQGWIPERELKQRYAGRISTVSFNDPYLIALSKGTPNSFWALGGDFELNPEELEKKVIDAYLSEVGEFQDLALRFYMAGKEHFTLENERDGKLIPFKYIIGLAHTYGIGYDDRHDLRRLKAVASAVPEIRSRVYFANLLPLEGLGAIPFLKPVQYKSSTVGNLREPQMDRTIRFLRIVSPSPNMA